MTDRPGWLFIIGIIIGMLVVLFVILFVIPWTSTARAQQRDRVTCYDSGNTRI
jgi:NADH:ubiquinone oxidoreductase subunit 3 (subunit A)